MSSIFENEFFTGTAPFTPGLALSIRIKEPIAAESMEDSLAELFRSEDFGLVLAVDGKIRLTEADEFMYHEMLAHVPMYAHEDPADVLIIGGETGGLAREILKHPCLEHLDFCGQDEEFADFCRKNLPWAQKAFSSSKAEVHEGTPAEFLKTHKKCYDLIIVDSPDPSGKKGGLYTKNFAELCKGSLKNGGVFAMPAGSLFSGQKQAVGTFRKFAPLFRYPDYYTFPLLSFPGGSIGIFIASDDHETSRPVRIPFRKFVYKLKAYSAAGHKAAFILPPFMIKAMDRTED